MYILEYKINKSLSKVRDELLLEYLKYLTVQKQITLTEHKKELASNALSCFLLNARYATHIGKTSVVVPRYANVYSTDLIYNCIKLNRKVSYTYTMYLCDFLVDELGCGESRGGATFEVDKVDYAKQKGDKKKAKMLVKGKTVSMYSFSQELIDHLQQATFKFEDVPMSVIEVRDSEGKAMPFKLTPKQRHMVVVLKSLNLEYKKNFICVDEDKLDLQLKKVYNNASLTLGGRNYMIGVDSTKAMKKTNRKKLTINGEPCVELDFKSFFPSMMADMLGITFPEGFDPYAIEVDGCNKELVRDIAKKACLILLNTTNARAAQCALASAMSQEEWKERIEEAKENGEWVEGRIIHAIVEKLLERNGYLAVECEADNALKYMNYESEVNDIVLERCLMDGFIVIPLHDSFITQKVNENKLRKHMERAYELVIGGNNCRISSKEAEV